MATARVLRYRDYDGDPVVGVFPTAKQADAIAAAIGGPGGLEESYAPTGYYVDSVALLPAGLAVEDLGTVYRWHLGWYWDGTVRGDEALDPERRLKITGLPEHYTSDVEAPFDGITVEAKADETNYTLGFWVHVSGPDEAAVLARAEECRAEYGADTKGMTARLWKLRSEQRPDYRIPDWIWHREENQGLLDALRALGVQ
jgi:hypothetical protein